MSGHLQLDSALNVFCDASVNSINGYFTSCPGYAIVYKDKIVASRYQVIFNASNNYGEIYALSMGIRAVIDKSYEIQYASRINVFSDSQISIFGLRDWIFSWYKRLNSDNQMVSDRNLEIANQEIFNRIVNMIAYEGIPMHLYHQLGHMNYNNKEHVLRVLRSFNNANKEPINYNEAKYICYYNDFVDRFTRDNLNSVTDSYIFNVKDYKKELVPVSILLNDNTMRRYKDLIYKG
jgi:ribonuclease HI